MAVYLKPCHGCPIPRKTDDKRCLERRDEMRKKVSGLGLTSAKFDCKILADHFHQGRRITINTPYMKNASSYWDDGYVVAYAEVPATVIGFHQGKFQCAVDLEAMKYVHEELNVAENSKDASAFVYRKPMPPSRVVRFLDEPNRELCKGGNVPINDGKCDRESCHICREMDIDEVLY